MPFSEFQQNYNIYIWYGNITFGCCHTGGESPEGSKGRCKTTTDRNRRKNLRMGVTTMLENVWSKMYRRKENEEESQVGK